MTPRAPNSDAVGSGGHPAYYQPTNPNPPWRDKIVMYNDSGTSIFTFIRLLHHENGHRHSKQLPPEKGGFGEDLAWSLDADEDYDLINDTWEMGDGAALGFLVNPSEESRATHQKWREAWDHGWITIEQMQNPPGEPYTNPDGYVPATGSGLTVRNENQVVERMPELRLKDWSSVFTPTSGE